jgi:hypothetical protein
MMEALWDDRVPNDQRLTNLPALFVPASEGLPPLRLGWGQSFKLHAQPHRTKPTIDAARSNLDRRGPRGHSE